VTGREVVRTPVRHSAVSHSPAPGDLYQQDNYGRTLLRSLMRAQLGATISVLVPAAALLLIYPLLAVLFPWLAKAQVGGLPLTFLILGGGIYPPLVLLGFWYRRRADKVEQRFEELLEDSQ
jgi:putative solute:sodium symporter small subunit